MWPGFVNPIMLIALSAVTLPIIVEWFSRRRHEVVTWGAMQFLQMETRQRRRLRLEEIILLLLRMTAIALLVIAFARPWGTSASWFRTGSQQNRDVVIVIDSSVSMQQVQNDHRLYDIALSHANQFLDRLQPGDTVALIDARDIIRPIVNVSTRDFDSVREQVLRLPDPTGSADIAGAIEAATTILSGTTNLVRDIVVITDGQSQGWKTGELNSWDRIEDTLQTPAVRPRVWITNVADRVNSEWSNFSLGPLQLSRSQTALGLDVRISANVRGHGTGPAQRFNVALAIDDVPVPEQQQEVSLAPGEEMQVAFDAVFDQAGPHLISIVCDVDDVLPADNRAEAVALASQAMPVLLVDGDPNIDSSLSETYFAQAALSSEALSTIWIDAKTVPWTSIPIDSLSAFDCIVLANVPVLSDELADSLATYTKNGGGLLIALGDRTDPQNYNTQLFERVSLLPRPLKPFEAMPASQQSAPQQISGASLDGEWLETLQKQTSGGLLDAEFTNWWSLTEPDDVQNSASSQSPQSSNPSPELARRGVDSTVVSRLGNGAPLLVEHQFGGGQVLLMTSTLDADWNSLPAKPDYVTFLHEALFRLAVKVPPRNVQPGSPLVLPIADEVNPIDYLCHAPSNEILRPKLHDVPRHKAWRVNDTAIAGRYTFQPRDLFENPAQAEQPFIVRFDRNESDLTPLGSQEQSNLAARHQLNFLGDSNGWRRQILDSGSRHEFWSALMIAATVLFVLESVLTRIIATRTYTTSTSNDVTSTTEHERQTAQSSF